MWALKSIAKVAVRPSVAPSCARRFSQAMQRPQQVTSPISGALLSYTSDMVHLTLSGQTTSFHSKWLWYNSSKHREPDSGQRSLAPFDLARAPKLQSAEVVDGGTQLKTKWTDGTESMYEMAWLADNDYSEPALKAMHERARPPVLRSCAKGTRVTPKADVPKFSYHDIVHSEKAVYEWLHVLNLYGLTLITDAPVEERTVLKAASRVSHPMWTIYGEVWDVAVMPNPINIAYSPISLDLHVDLVYYESPPGLQLLHCRQFDADINGGESTFLDGLHLAEEFRRRHPQQFDTLTKLPATFQKIHYNRSKPAHIQMQRPHITIDPSSGDITSVFWAPPFEGPLRLPPASVPEYFDAYEKFSALLAELQDGPFLVEYRMQPGEISVFNNRRMLHGRRNFFAPASAPNAQRILQGCYVNIDEYKSRLCHLSTLYGDIKEVKRVSNQNWY